MLTVVHANALSATATEVPAAARVPVSITRNRFRGQETHRTRPGPAQTPARQGHGQQLCPERCHHGPECERASDADDGGDRARATQRRDGEDAQHEASQADYEQHRCPERKTVSFRRIWKSLRVLHQIVKPRSNRSGIPSAKPLTQSPTLSTVPRSTTFPLQLVITDGPFASAGRQRRADPTEKWRGNGGRVIPGDRTSRPTGARGRLLGRDRETLLWPRSFQDHVSLRMTIAELMKLLPKEASHFDSKG